MKDCVFCKILNHEIPSYKIYEDEFTYAFLDIANDVNYHTLVIPKKHVCNVLDCDSETLSHVMNTCKKLMNHYVDNLHFDGCNLLNATGEAAQQSVMHLHFHIIPRKCNDQINGWPNYPGASKSLEECAEFLKVK